MGGTTTHNQVDFIPYHHQQLLRQSPEFEAAHALFQTVVFCVGAFSHDMPIGTEARHGLSREVMKGMSSISGDSSALKTPQLPINVEKKGAREH